ncbi:MAG: phosphatase PAP2 family protein [Bacteroidota bacterium]|jgi:undecaprenyl-diphosphatase
MAEQAGKKPFEEPKGAAQQAAKAEVTPRPVRDYRSYLFQLGLIAVIGAFTTLMLLVKITPSFPIDLAITRALQSITNPVFAWLMDAISWPGFSPQSFIIPLVIVGVLYAFGFHWEAVAAIFAAFFPALINVIVKDYIRRPRPGIDLVHVFKVLNSYSFPSGHVMFYVGFYGFLWFLVYSLLKRSWMRTSILIFLGLLIVLVGPSRVYLGQHWPSDVLGAYLLGALCLVIEIVVYRWGKKRFFVHQPVASEKPKTGT